MIDKFTDPVFGEMQYRHKWYKVEQFVLFGECRDIKISARAYEGQDITDMQRDAYIKFKTNAATCTQEIERQLKEYINSNVDELSATWINAREVFTTADLRQIVTPKEIVVKRDGTLIVLFDCQWDANGIAVMLYPYVAIGEQGIFL